MNRKTLVITGCTGFIGYYVTRECLRKGWFVYGIDKQTYVSNFNAEERLKGFCGCGKKYGKYYTGEEFTNECFKRPRKKICNCPEQFTFLKEDICNLTRIPDCDYVINLAAETHVGNSIIDCKDFIQTNVEGVRNLLEIIKRKPDNVRQKPVFFQVSTDEVYGDLKEGKFDETADLNPSNPYAASKAGADMLIQSWYRTYGVNYNILRPTNNYGKWQFPEKLIPLSIKLLQEGKKIRLHDGGEPVRSWLHAADTAEAIITIIEKGELNNIYNIGGTEELPNIETVEHILANFLGYTNKDARAALKAGGDDYIDKYFDLAYKRPGQDVRYALDDSKLKNLGWMPKIEFKKEITNIVHHYKNNFRW